MHNIIIQDKFDIYENINEFNDVYSKYGYDNI